jgi:hypothetical protein
VTAGEDAVHHLLLDSAEVVESEHRFQNFVATAGHADSRKFD